MFRTVAVDSSTKMRVASLIHVLAFRFEELGHFMVFLLRHSDLKGWL
jgi:hypothetical protein